MAGTREVRHDTAAQTQWLVLSRQPFFLVFILWPFPAYVRNRSWSSSSRISLFPHCWTPSVLLKSPSCFHVLLVCGTLSWGLLAWAKVEGFCFFFFTGEHWKLASVPAVKKAPLPPLNNHQVAILQLQPWPWSTSPITCVLKQSF